MAQVFVESKGYLTWLSYQLEVNPTWNPPLRDENQICFLEVGLCHLLGRTMSCPFLGYTHVSPSADMLHHTCMASLITPRLGSIQYHPNNSNIIIEASVL